MKNKQLLKSPDKMVAMPDTYYRPGTPHPIDTLNFWMVEGGVGDYINHMPTFEYLAEMQPQVKGRLFVYPPFLETARYIMRKYDHWKVLDYKVWRNYVKPGENCYMPSSYTRYISSAGAHLLDLGFMMSANLARPPQGYNRLPDLTDYNEPWAWPELDPTSKYAVFTPGATAKNRTMPAKAFNELVKYTIEKGITPVYLGKKDIRDSGVNHVGYYAAEFDKDYDFSVGVDLREKTTLLEAVQIMKSAKFVLGLDNGLINLAGTTKVPVIFGLTIQTRENRELRRPEGPTVYVEVDRKELPCIGCMANMRHTREHDFRYCIYTDYKCLDLLFKDDSAEWKKSIDFFVGDHDEK